MNKISSYTVVSALLLLSGIFLVQPASADDRVVHERSILDSYSGGFLAFINVTNGPDPNLMLDRISTFHVRILTDGVTLVGTNMPNFNWFERRLPFTATQRSVTFITGRFGSDDSIDLGSNRTFGIATDLPEYEIKWWTADINGEIMNSGKLRININPQP